MVPQMKTLVDMPTAPLIARHLVTGRWVAEGCETSVVLSPYTGTPLGTTCKFSQEVGAFLVEGAVAASAAWRAVPIKERSTVLLRFREILLREIETLAHSVAREAGKTVAEGRAEILKGIEVLEFAASLQNSDVGGVLEVSRGVTCEYKREPLGVVAGITPFNFPVMVPMWMIPIAIALGNAFILKPSEKVPFTPCLLGEFMLEAGVPPGVFSILHGDREAVEFLANHERVSAIGFVGSTPIARSVYARVSSVGKRALCLGGAKNHLIVVPDADPRVAIDGIFASFTGCAGQRCMAASVLVAVGDVEHIVQGVKELAEQTQLGTGMGALINKAARTRLCAAIEKSVMDGAKLVVDGRGVPAPAGYEGGNWLGPTVLDHATQTMECAHTELFGPVLTIVRVRTLEEALRLEGASPFGNATSVFTTSGSVAQKVAQRSASGMIGINVGVPVPREPFSFGGTKDSKFGHGDITGAGGVEFWSNQKKITAKWGIQSDKNWMS